jgi:hypothetical protein
VLDSHSGSGTRERTHPHYLKGLISCGRCGYRFIVQRAKGNGGVYYYFLCRGKQQHVCDQPYVPVEVIEQAVEDHYGRAVMLPTEFRAEVRTGVDQALKQNHTLSDTMRRRYRDRLDALERKEDYFLDLAAEEGWPKDKLRSKIEGLRKERRDIERSLEQTEGRLKTGRDIFLTALDLLDDPQAMYRRSGEQVRGILNKAFFTKLYIDGRKVSDQELREPFDILVGAYEARQAQQEAEPHPRAPKLETTYYRRSDSLRTLQTDKRASSMTGASALDRSSVISSLLHDLGHGWSKGVLVELSGLEPLTPCLQTGGGASLGVHSAGQRPGVVASVRHDAGQLLYFADLLGRGLESAQNEPSIRALEARAQEAEGAQPAWAARPNLIDKARDRVALVIVGHYTSPRFQRHCLGESATPSASGTLAARPQR